MTSTTDTPRDDAVGYRPSGKYDEYRTDYEIGLDNGYALASRTTDTPRDDAVGRTLADVYATILAGDFYSDYDQSTADLKILRNAVAALASRAVPAGGVKAEDYASEAQQVWPEWAEQIHAFLKKLGYYESSEDDIHLPDDLEEWFDEAVKTELSSRLSALASRAVPAEVLALEAARDIAKMTHVAWDTQLIARIQLRIMEALES